jgi:caa(3)-type oxidase subunit IV
MSEAHDPHAHHGPNVKAYFAVFGALSVFTLVSFVVNGTIGKTNPMASAGIIMVVAVIKAVLVAMIFMHLKWDFNRLYFLIFPVFILATMMMIVLLPDIFFAWKH